MRQLAVVILLSALASSGTPVTGETLTAAPANAQLPPEIMVDRHLLRAERLLAADDPAGALDAMNEILALQDEHDLVMPDDFDFQYAQVAYGRTDGDGGRGAERVPRGRRAGGRVLSRGAGAARFRRAAARAGGGGTAAGAATRRSGTTTSRPLAGHVFRDCETCPEMVVLPGSAVALGRYEVTLGEYRAFAAATGGGAATGCGSLLHRRQQWRALLGQPGLPADRPYPHRPLRRPHRFPRCEDAGVARCPTLIPVRTAGRWGLLRMG